VVLKVYLVSLLAGVLVGVVYSLLNVRSPAPPVVALVGLLGILAGEQIVPIGKQILAGKPLFSACTNAQTIAHLFGRLPGRNHDETKT
jgi:XapX domain-containing protein